MTRVVASPHATRAAAAVGKYETGIALYHVGRPQLAGLGHGLQQAVRCLPRPPSVVVWDFLSIALAVFGTDRFLSRRDTADGWTRLIVLEIDIADPDPWTAQSERIAAALRFLTGDIWHVRFHSGGLGPPEFQASLSDRDCACLFSGGLDSLVGAIDLVAAGRRPLIVSQASPKEGPVQARLAQRIGLAQHRFEGRVTERAAPPYEPCSRARSVLFIAYGTLAATALGGGDGASVELVIPENGLISVNPPLTRRRLGSLSTRTTHPHFLALLQEIVDEAGIGVAFVNPYNDKSKGEMLLECGYPIAEVAAASYSCSKGKRLNMHCGRCVPCLIRRAAFHRAGIADHTRYAADDLTRNPTFDDLFAARLAAAALAHRDVAQWATENGPLPADPTKRESYVEVVRRGLGELRDFLETVCWP
jgi:hypothetical protein